MALYKLDYYYYINMEIDN